MKIENAKDFPQAKDKLAYTAMLSRHHFKLLYDHKYEKLVFLCLDCEMLSYNQNDLNNLYCGNCHEFKGANR